MDIKLNKEQTKKFKASLIDEARRILTERQRAEREKEKEKRTEGGRTNGTI